MTSRRDNINIRGFGAPTLAPALRLPGDYGPWGRWGTDLHGELAVVEQAQRAEQPTALLVACNEPAGFFRVNSSKLKCLVLKAFYLVFPLYNFVLNKDGNAGEDVVYNRLDCHGLYLWGHQGEGAACRVEVDERPAPEGGGKNIAHILPERRNCRLRP